MSGKETVKVLVVGYEGLDFLLSREQVSTSQYISEAKRLRSPRPYLEEALPMEDGSVPLIDLDKFLQDTFRVSRDGNALIALLSGLSLFSPAAGKALRRFLPRGTGGKARDTVAFRIPSVTAMEEIPLAELRLNPPGLAEHLERRGVPALRFSGGRMQFFLDIDVLIANEMLRPGKEES